MTVEFSDLDTQSQYNVYVSATDNYVTGPESVTTPVHPLFQSQPVVTEHISPFNAAEYMKRAQPQGGNGFTFVIAHGGVHNAPGCAENSLCAIRSAYEAGADGIELDIRVTSDGVPVLGRDVSVGRELQNWTNAPLSRTWTPFQNFPLPDPTYTDLTKIPFQINVSDPANTDLSNPLRTKMTFSSMQNKQLLDSFNRPTVDHQLKLADALAGISQNYPMLILLNIKSKNDLAVIGPVIQQARNLFSNSNGALTSIGLKLDWSTISAAEVNGNPGAYLGLSNIYYCLVMGTGDLDSMASWSSGNSDPQVALQALCKVGNGCLGPEIAHKYPGAPTQNIFDFAIQKTTAGDGGFAQIAGAHKVPQYGWYTVDSFNSDSTTLKTDLGAYGRWYSRADGSCCFSLRDTLSVSKNYGSESQDLRELYSWNENNFTTITTDDPLQVIRDLKAAGKRPTNVARDIGTIDDGSGMQNDDDLSKYGVYKDGAYRLAITNPSAPGGQLLINSALNTSQINPSSPLDNPDTMWYLSQKSGYDDNRYYYTITNAKTNLGLKYSGANGSGTLVVAEVSPTDSTFLWNVNGNAISPVSNMGTAFLRYNGALKIVSSNNVGSSINLVSTGPSLPETTQVILGPPGYTYCGEFQKGCNTRLGVESSWAFGSGDRMTTTIMADGPMTCDLSFFSGVDPAPGTNKKSCFYAPYDLSAALPSNKQRCASEGGLCTSSVSGSLAFGPYKTIFPGTHTNPLPRDPCPVRSAVFHLIL